MKKGEDWNVEDTLYLDVTPLSLGIRTAGGLCRTLITRHTLIPCSASLVFSTNSDFQSKMVFRLLQGESRLAEHNRTLAEFTLDGLIPSARGSVQVIVQLEIDGNGILTVHARDLATGSSHQVKAAVEQGLTGNEIEQLVRNAGLPPDPKSAALESAQRMAYVAGHLIVDFADRMAPESSQRLQTAHSGLNRALAGDSLGMETANREMASALSAVFLELEMNPMAQPKMGEKPAVRMNNPANPLPGFNLLEIRQGGMGSVYILLKDGRLFALKTLRDELLADPGAVLRFISEARTWMSLERHTNIVCALLVREIDERPYLFLEYADSGSLENRLGKLDLPEALDYAVQICSGMSFAYGKAGIVHRDLKPANILLAKDDRFRCRYAARVTDFGLAGAWKATPTDAQEVFEEQMSRGMGTLPYMPPEQFSESTQAQFGYPVQPVSVRSDIYSFGVLLYELLTGKRPFHNLQDIFSGSMESPIKLNSNITPALAVLIYRCLALKPGERWVSFQEVQSELINIYEQLTGEVYRVIGAPEELTYLDWIAQGASLLALGDFQEGIKAYEKSLSLVKDFPPAVQGKGLCLENSGQIDQALACYEAALKTNPYLEDALLGKARCLARKNRFGEAAACYERACEAQLLTSIGAE